MVNNAGGFSAPWSKVITLSYIGSTQCYFSSIGERVFAVSWLIGATDWEGGVCLKGYWVIRQLNDRRNLTMERGLERIGYPSDIQISK